MVARDRMIDLGLNALASESDRVFLSATDPATYADVNTTHIGVKVGSRGSMFYTLSTPVQGGRLASLVGFFDGDITSNGTANFVVVADSVNQNVLLSEALGVPQAVVSGAKFSIGSLDIVFGSSSQPVAASLIVSSPVIGIPNFAKTPTTSQNLSVSSPVLGQPILIVTTSGWTNVSISNMVGTFTCEFDAVPSALASNDVAGLSNGPAAAFTDLACIVQFSAANTILVRNGGSYTSDVSVPYSAGQQFHIRFVGNITAHLYDVYITPLSQAEAHLATAYAFRTEQSAVTQLNNFSLNATDIGTVAISNLTFNSIAANPLTVGSPVIPLVIINGKTNLFANNMSVGSPVLSSPVMIVKRSFVATTMVDSSPVFTSPSLTINSAGTAAGPFNAQSGDFAISWDASPSQSLADVVTGLSNGAPAAVTDFGCIVRFSNVGNIDCRNGAAYGATTTVPYSAGLSFNFRLAVRLTNHTFDAFVTPQGQSEILLASNFAFRTEQASIAQLNYLGEVALTGTVALSNMIGPPPPALPPVVSNQTMSLSTSGTGWVAGNLVGTMVATNAPTSWTITAGNASGFYAIANNGNITVTSAGITGLNGGTGTSSLTVRATNAFGIGSGTATVNYAPASSGNILHATTSNFAAQVSAAANGDTVLLATGNYGTWTGTNKAITVAPEVGANPVVALNLGNAAANFTLDGGHTEISSSTNGMVRSMSSFTSSGINVGPSNMTGTPGPQNVTITRCWFTTSGSNGIVIDGLTNSNIVIDRCWFHQINGATAAIWFPYSGNAFVTISNCYFEDFSSDGMQVGAQKITVQDCEFNNVNPHGNASLHTDCIQLFGGSSCTFRRNFFQNFEQALGAFDGTDSNIIEDNVTMGFPYSAAHYITMMADSPGSTINHNTIPDGQIYLSSKAGGVSSKSFVRNNVSSGGIGLTGSGVTGQPSQDTNNLIPGASAPDISGTATFVGGVHPTTWAGFKLTSGSAGRNAGTDGLDCGIRAA